MGGVVPGRTRGLISIRDILPLGETALLLQFDGPAGPQLSQQVIAAADWLTRQPLPGLLGAAPAYASITVRFDPLRVRQTWPKAPSPTGAVRNWLQQHLPMAFRADASKQGNASGVFSFRGEAVFTAKYAFLPSSHPPVNKNTPEAYCVEWPWPTSDFAWTTSDYVVPVRYDGPDLEDVARRLGCTPAEVIERHSAGEYLVCMIGFLPGFPYLGFLPDNLVLPRRDTPRSRVPAGSVAIAGRQTGIYPQASPGGWHLIGRTDLILFDAERNPPNLFKAGDRIRFVAI